MSVSCTEALRSSQSTPVVRPIPAGVAVRHQVTKRLILQRHGFSERAEQASEEDLSKSDGGKDRDAGGTHDGPLSDEE